MLYAKGLENVVVAKTTISAIDGEQGTLLYRGYQAEELAKSADFENVAYLLLNGQRPTEAEKDDFSTALKTMRPLPDDLKKLLAALPKDLSMMDALRTLISSYTGKEGWPPQQQEAMRLVAIVPTIVAAWANRSCGKDAIEPDPSLNHVANYLYMLTGEKPHAAHIRALSAYLILTAEHGMNASTFAARVIASTEADLRSAICGALGALKGRLHGGAPTGVLEPFSDIQTADTSSETLLREKLERGERLMGFGHRVYKTTDPRANALREVLKSLNNQETFLSEAVAIEQLATQLLAEYKPGRQLHANVEYYAAAIMEALRLKPEWFTPTFCVSRVVGWCSHVIEQSQDNRIMRPQQQYYGPKPD